MNIFKDDREYSIKATGKAEIVAEPYGEFSIRVEVLEKTPKFWSGYEEDLHWRRIDRWGRWAFPWWECITFDTYQEALVALRWLCKKDKIQYYLEKEEHNDWLNIEFDGPGEAIPPENWNLDRFK